ncbi:unnamed protein product [Kluyveromyces dobzhanskii CBS 2104]|uniref:WGS project CCBQ000000000 data, contig 00015 n=1 Tax=Kluyveromyces dobzhanskii CBS 2104 TaxID=1427455 RepID=A0A0A8L8N3_9SACH|nr:unnamed protein product [Kluyveromyces dobzhanskii CBS 2104]
MALANSRPLNIPTMDDEVIANSKSPLFDASTLVSGNKSGSESESGKAKSNGKNDSKPKKNSTASFASSQLSEIVSISKTIPVTGERPKPGNEGPILSEDDVLYAIFVILWENDPSQQGMTVKQLCDLLLEKHPDMNNLSTKLSNLISAKLNAYVKKVEKGERGLSYALSREWSDASPRRMVYIYRGILAADYEKHAQAAAALAASSLSSSEQGSNSAGKNKTKSKKQMNKSSSDLGLEADAAQSADLKDGAIPRSASAMGGMKSSTFSAGNIVNDFNIPYMSSPVSVSLTPKLGDLSLSNLSTELDADSHIIHTGKRLSMSQDRPGKRLKMDPSANTQESHMSQANQQQQQPVYVTIASSTPRLSRNPSKQHESNNAAASEAAHTVAEILKTVVTQNPIVISPRSSKASSPLASAASSQEQTKPTKENNCQWLRTLRDGFLLEDIPTPESLSPDELDEFFA